MKFNTAYLHDAKCLHRTAFHIHVPATIISVRDILALLSALATAGAIVMLSIWVAGIDIRNIIGASTWGLTLVFLALAVDSQKPIALLHLLTAGALLVTAMLQYVVSPDYVIASGTLMATWAGVVVFKRLQ